MEPLRLTGSNSSTYTAVTGASALLNNQGHINGKQQPMFEVYIGISAQEN
jgi:hypothetical protein